MVNLTNGIGWGGTNGGGELVKRNKDKNKKLVVKKLIIFWGLSTVLSVAPYQAFTESLLDRKSYQCIKKLWHKESRWNPKSVSPTHDYGIPQRHMKTASKQAIAEFMENPYTQILWGLGYVEHRYGSACKAWAHSQRKGWY
jgi:hypothetical protein